MKIEYVETQWPLPKGFRIAQYEDSDIVTALKDPAKVTMVTDVINKYLRQKDALVDGRKQLVALIETTTSFARKMTTVVVDGKPTEAPDETDGPYFQRFLTAATAGNVKEVKVNPALNEEQREAEVYSWLQKLADKCGDVDQAGAEVKWNDDNTPGANAYAFKLDMTRPPKAPGKPKTPPKYAMDGATNIINNKSEAGWIKKFAEGFTAKTGEKIVPIKHESFTTSVPTGATPEQAESIRKANIAALAWAITDVEDQKRAQRVADYA
jgi:hypothetical protein